MNVWAGSVGGGVMDEYICDACSGTGTRDIGDCEDGVLGECLACDGEGVIYV